MLLLRSRFSCLLARSRRSFAGGCGVADGDTMSIRAWYTRCGCGLHGIDAPEQGQAFSNRAKQFAADLVFGKEVNVRAYGFGSVRTDYPRGVVIGWTKRQSRNCFARAFAWWFRRYATGDRKLEKLEEKAWQARRGLWADRYPMPPWEWRRGLRNAGSRCSSL